MTKVATYLRISEDPNDTRAGVDRQRADCQAIARVRGWEVGQEYVDNDLSAYKRKVKRPAFERMLEDLRDGVIEGVVVWDLDRFVRQPRDLERAIDIYEDRKWLVFATAQGDLDLQSSDGRTMARVMVAFANKSSADTGRRVARAHLANAEAGKPVGGWRPFGWQADKATLDPVEAPIARKVINDVLAGRSLYALAGELNDAGVTTTTGKTWDSRTLRQWLKNPRLVGWRTHRRSVLHDEHGKPVRGLWEPLVDEETWERLCVALRHPDRRSRKPRRGLLTYLLSGVCRCGLCNRPMYGNRTGEGRYYYTCNGFGHTIGVSGVETDKLIKGLCLQKLESVEMDGSSTPWSGEAQLRQAQEQIDQMMSAFVEGRLGAETVFPRVRALEQKVEEMKEARSLWLAETTGPDLEPISEEEWDAMKQDEQRAIVSRLIDAVLVKPATRRGNRMDPSRLDVAWRTPT